MLGVRLVKNEMPTVYHKGVLAVCFFVRGAKMTEQAQRIHPAEIVRDRMMKNGLQRTAVVGCHVTSVVGSVALICHPALRWLLQWCGANLAANFGAFA